MRKAVGSILALMKALGLFSGSSWDAWRVVLKGVFCLPMSEAELAVYRRLTERQQPPALPCRRDGRPASTP